MTSLQTAVLGGISATVKELESTPRKTIDFGFAVHRNGNVNVNFDVESVKKLSIEEQYIAYNALLETAISFGNLMVQPSQKEGATNNVYLELLKPYAREIEKLPESSRRMIADQFNQISNAILHPETLGAGKPDATKTHDLSKASDPTNSSPSTAPTTSSTTTTNSTTTTATAPATADKTDSNTPSSTPSSSSIM